MKGCLLFGCMGLRDRASQFLESGVHELLWKHVKDLASLGEAECAQREWRHT